MMVELSMPALGVGVTIVLGLIGVIYKIQSDRISKTEEKTENLENAFYEGISDLKQSVGNIDKSVGILSERVNNILKIYQK